MGHKEYRISNVTSSHIIPSSGVIIFHSLYDYAIMKLCLNDVHISKHVNVCIYVKYSSM